MYPKYHKFNWSQIMFISVKYLKSLWLEYGFCIGSFGLIFVHLALLMPPNDPKILQYDTFQDFALDLLDCSSVATNNIYKSNDDKLSLSVRPPICPIDEERLNRFTLDGIKHRLNFGHVERGGRFRPKGCRPLQKTAIIIPFRNREDQLEKFTSHMHQFLPSQMIDYTIYVVEQNDSKPFNRAKLFNIGFLESSKLQPDICCFIFHDVDLLPMDQRNLYMCSSRPRHMSSQVNTFRFNLLYQELFGGVVAIAKSQYIQVGGFANSFYGWGGEDDDMFRRIIKHNITLCRAPSWISMYTMMRHTKDKPNPSR